MRATETRFVGNGNVWVADGRYRGWEVICCRCGAVKTVTSHHGTSLPPNVIVKKLLQSGWYLGRKPEEDVCKGCRSRKPNKVTNGNAERPAIDKAWGDPRTYFARLRAIIEIAKKAATAKQHYKVASCLDEALLRLDPEVTVAVIAMVQPVVKTEPPSVSDVKPVRAATTKQVSGSSPAQEPKPVESDADYDRWLAGLSKETPE